MVDRLPFKSQNRYSAVRVRRERRPAGPGPGRVEALHGHSWARRMGKTSSWTWRVCCPRDCAVAVRRGGRQRSARPAFGGSLEGFTLRPLALLALSDELRPEARDVLRLLAGQGIDFKIISGDNPDTVRATVGPPGRGAEEPALQALTKERVVTGAELEAAGEGPMS